MLNKILDLISQADTEEDRGNYDIALVYNNIAYGEIFEGYKEMCARAREMRGTKEGANIREWLMEQQTVMDNLCRTSIKLKQKILWGK